MIFFGLSHMSVFSFVAYNFPTPSLPHPPPKKNKQKKKQQKNKQKKNESQQIPYETINMMPRESGVACWSAWYRCLNKQTNKLKKKKKTMRKGTFFKLDSARRCHRLGSEKWYFSD